MYTLYHRQIKGMTGGYVARVGLLKNLYLIFLYTI